MGEYEKINSRAEKEREERKIEKQLMEERNLSRDDREGNGEKVRLKDEQEKGPPGGEIDRGRVE